MEQYEWWQFRISKSKGRVIGIFIENCFHIVWLDRYHNLTNSEGMEKRIIKVNLFQYGIIKNIYIKTFFFGNNMI